MILVINYTKAKITPAFVRRILLSVWRVLKYKAEISEVSVALVGPAEIRRLNRTWRKKDKVTDVLSFGSLDWPTKKIPADLGEIIICSSRAKEQAKELGHSFKHEIAFLLVHGLLHLLGYDHERSEREDRLVRRMQEEILSVILERSDRIQKLGSGSYHPAILRGSRMTIKYAPRKKFPSRF